MRRFRARWGRSFPRNCRKVIAPKVGFCSVTNCPWRRFTAPNNATDLRVGACSNTGSVFSGGTHITARVPCCWKWHSSKLHKSMPGSWARRRSFFISHLRCWVRLGNDRSRLAESEAQVMKEALALSRTQANAVGLIQMMGEQLSIPEIVRIAELAGRVPQVAFHLPQLRRREPRRTARPLSFLQPRQASPLKTVHPTLHGRGILSQPLSHLVTIQALADEQQSMQAMVVTRLVRSKNLLLQRHAQEVNIRNLQLPHCSPSCPILRAGGGGQSTDLYCII